jgi:U6 snRNA-associated Sm-like protein LSm8
LEGFDQTLNIILSQSHERVFSLDEPVNVVQLGLYVMRGDNVAVVGLIDEDIEASLDYEVMRADVIPAVAH